ncbi:MULTISPECIES: hypothetical protein [unclassified Nocardia]|uniref:hypothetical protein n=1 Tax=unclassified Nocardia TaxID=2637762 RepID=UPI001CE430E5|nr:MULTISPECIES: hypothetical protein [unclassified Nocardia]
MAIKLEKILRFGGGSIVRGTVDVKNVVTHTGVSAAEVNATITAAKDSGLSNAYAGVSGRSGADATGHTDADLAAALFAAYGPGPRGGAINVTAAAKGEGKSPSTIKRWLTGKAKPKDENRARLLANARKAATTKAGRSKAIAGRRASASGAKMAKYGAKLIVKGIQGRQGYERDRSVTWDLPPELVDDALNAYENGGDIGLADFMADYANTDAYGNLDDWNVFTFDTVALDEKSK